jgi:hypothetical protein
VSSYLLKLERARDHLQDLVGKEREFFNRTPAPARIEGQYNDDHSTYSFRFRVDQQPPASFSLIIGDFLTNLMASLDHWVYELSSVKSEKIGFPICLTPEDFTAEEKGRKLIGLKKPIVDAIRDWQPFSMSPKNPETDRLSMLKALANWDKHRTLHLTVAHPMGATYSPWIGADIMALAYKPAPFGPFNDGDLMATFDIPKEFRDKKTPITGNLHAALIFDENVPSPTRQRWFVLGLLQGLLFYVERGLAGLAVTPR